MVEATLFETGFMRSTYSGAADTTLKEMYSIAIINPTDGNAIRVDNIDPHAAFGSTPRIKAEYYFSVPPKNIEMSEPYATKIIPTQNGGKYVESHGSIIRDIRIQGNSGLRPNKPLPLSINLLSGIPLGPLAAPVNSLAGPIINRADRLATSATDLVGALGAAFGATTASRGLVDSERTGFDDIMFLRNIFRHYSDRKRTNQNSSNALMVWRNAKDADYWIVEPKEFKLIQDSKSPLTYNYQITFKTLGRFEFTFKATPDPLAAINASKNLIAQIQTSSRELTNTLLVVSSQIDRLAGAGVFAQNLIMEPIIRAVQGTSAMVGSAQGFTPTFTNNWQRLEDSLNEAVDRLDKKLYPSINKDNLGVVSVPLTANEQDIADSYRAVAASLRTALRASRRVLALPGIRDSIDVRTNNKKNALQQNYKKVLLGGQRQGSVPETAGDKSFLGNEQMGGSVAVAEVGPRDTIRSLAARLLGNRNRWQILALLNDLRAPYITETGEEQTLSPGSFILYPVNDGRGIKIQNLNASDLEQDQKGQNRNTAVERAYGRDIRLTSDFKNRTDLFVNTSGDLGSIVGIPNVKQGIRLKFSTEQGALTVHPTYGASFPIGRKATQASFNEFRLNTYATLISDPRVQAIKKLKFLSRGAIISIGAELLLKQTSDTTTTEFSVRSF